MAHGYPVLPGSGQEHKATDGSAATSCALDLIIGHYMISPSCFLPEESGLMQFIICPGQISGAHSAIIAAY